MSATLVPDRTIVSAVIDETQRDELIRLARFRRPQPQAQVRRAVAEHLQRADRHETEECTS